MFEKSKFTNRHNHRNKFNRIRNSYQSIKRKTMTRTVNLWKMTKKALIYPNQITENKNN